MTSRCAQRLDACRTGGAMIPTLNRICGRSIFAAITMTAGLWIGAAPAQTPSGPCQPQANAAPDEQIVRCSTAINTGAQAHHYLTRGDAYVQKGDYEHLDSAEGRPCGLGAAVLGTHARRPCCSGAHRLQRSTTARSR